MTFWQIFGIVIASVVCFFILTLHIPFRYKLKLNKDKSFTGRIIISFLFHILHAYIDYNEENGPWIYVKVFSITVYKKDVIELWNYLLNSDEEDDETDENADAGADDTLEGGSDNNDITEDKCVDDTVGDNEDNIDENAADNVNTDSKNVFGDEESSTEDEPTEDDDLLEQRVEEYLKEDAEFEKLPLKKRVKSIKRAIKETVLKIKRKWYNIKGSYESFRKKYNRTVKYIKHYYKLLHLPCVEPAYRKLKKCIFKLLKQVKPTKTRINLHIGTGDPDSTGKLFGYYCMIYPFYRKSIKFIPEWNDTVYEGNVMIKGKVLPVYGTHFMLKILLDKNVRRVIRIIMREVNRKNGRR